MTICKVTKIKCPYCGNVHDQHFEIAHIGEHKVIATCWEEENGCGKDYVLKYTANLETKPLKIEGK